MTAGARPESAGDDRNLDGGRPRRGRRIAITVALAGAALAAAVIAYRRVGETVARGESVDGAPPTLAIAAPPRPALLLDVAPAARVNAAATPADAAREPDAGSAASDALALAVRNERPAEVVARCAANSELAARNLTACLTAACRVHDTKKARRWWEVAGAQQRTETAGACKGLLNRAPPAPAVLPSPRSNPPTVPTAHPPASHPPGVDCDAQPMECRT